jgi:hypothetical protein
MRTGSRRTSSFKKPPSCSAIIFVLLQYTTVFGLLHNRSRRDSISGEGKPCSEAPRNQEQGQDRRSTTETTGTPPSKRTTASLHNTTDCAANSSAPPAETLLSSTLCTRWDPVFPHPPAAGAAAGGRGNRRNRRRRGEQEGGFRNRLSALFTGRGWVQVPFHTFGK